MKRLSTLLTALLLSSAFAHSAIAGAPPRVDPNAPPVEYWEPEPEPAVEQQAPKKEKKQKAAKKEKKASEQKH